MKNFIITLVIALLLLGCNDMDLNPLSEGSSGNWYSDDTELSLSLNKLYDLAFWENWYGPYNTGWLNWHDAWSDDWTQRTNLGIMAAGTVNGQTDAVIKIWETAYKCIANANFIIENIGRAAGSISQDKMNAYIGDARFVRAAQYSKLIFLFGDVPFFTKTLNIDQAFSLSRTSKNEVLDQIYADLDFAITHLPVSYSSNEYTHATKGAAMAMKARIALYMGNYTIARDAAKACIDLGVYTLYPDYGKFFGQKNTSETVFAIPRSVGLGSYINIEQIVCRNCGGYSTVQPSWDLFCSFLCTDGLPIDESPLFDPHNPFKNRDPRCAQTIVEFGSRHLGVRYEPHPDSIKAWNYKTSAYMSNNDSKGVAQYASFNGLVWKKWINDEWYTNNRGDMPNIVIRYADVLLMYAEAKIELGEIDQSVRDAINKVRARAYGVDFSKTTSYPAVSATNQAGLRKILRIERRMEFAFEGGLETSLRYADLVRWRLAEKVLNTSIYGLLDVADLREKVVKPGLWFFPEVPPIDEDGVANFGSMYNKGLIKLLALRTFDPSKHYLLPIPTKEILINKNLVQNPKY